MPSKKRKFGDVGEEFAKDYLLSKGYAIVLCNYQKPWGEIDIIAEKAGIIRFIEVKTSRFYPESSFTPEIRVNKKKIRSLKRICETYLLEQKLPPDREWQIDVISVILNDDDTLREINHIENAVFERPYWP